MGGGDGDGGGGGRGVRNVMVIVMSCHIATADPPLLRSRLGYHHLNPLKPSGYYMYHQV